MEDDEFRMWIKLEKERRPRNMTLIDSIIQIVEKLHASMKFLTWHKLSSDADINM